MAGQFTTVGIELVVRRMASFTKATQTIRRQIGITGVQANRMSKQFRSASSMISGFGNSIRNAGNQVLILGFQLTFLASGAMAAFISKAVQFEKSMVKIITLVGVAEGRVAQWAEQLLEIGPALGKSPVELAEALFVITSAGIRDQAEAIDVLTQSAKAASVGLGETEAVARVITGAMQAYEDVNLTAAQAVDILVATIREGNIEVESLAPTLGRVIATAANMGVTFAEVGAFIATFSRTAVPAEVAVTSLRAALNALLKPTAAAEDKLAEYNITMQDVWDAIKDPERGLHDTLLALSLVFGDNNEEMAEVIGSARGLAGIFTVTGGLAEEYVEIFEKVSGSMGITDEAFERFTKTTAFMGASAKASFDSLAVAIGATLLPGLNALLEAITPVFDAIRELAELHPKITIFTGVLAGIVTVIGPLLIISGLLVSSLGTLVIAIGSFAGFIVSLLSPLALVAAAIAALFAGMALAIGISLGDAQEKLDRKGESLTTRAWEWGKNMILALAKGMGAAARAVTEVLILIGNHIKDLLQSLSPPKLLPDIGKWGMRTMETWIEGWLLADFSKFKDIAGLVESVIRSLTFDSDLWGGFSDEESLDAILRSRTAIAAAIEEIGETGKVAQETLDAIFDSDIVGASSDALKEYVGNLLDVEIATKALADVQKELNDAQEHFESILDPLNDQLERTEKKFEETLDPLNYQLERAKTKFEEILDPLNDQLERTEKKFREVLKGLNDELDRTTASYAKILSPIDEEIKALEDRRQAILDQREEEELRAIIADVNAPALAKEVAQMRLRHMELVKQKLATEDERDTAVDSVQAKIDAQEKLRDAELDSLKERIDAQEKLREAELDSLEEQIDAQEKLRETALDSLEEQIDAQEELRDTSLEAIQLRVDAAQEVADIANDELSTTEAQIRLQIENNELAKEYVQLLESQKKKTKSLADAVGGLADALAEGGGLEGFFGKGGAGEPGEVGEEGGGLLENFNKEMQQLVIDVKALIAESKAAFLEGYGDTKLAQDLADVWSDVLVEAAEKLDSAGLIPVLGAFIKGAITGSVEYALAPKEGESGGIIWDILEKVLFGDTTPTLGQRIIDMFVGYFQNVYDILKGIWVLIIDQNIPLAEFMIEEALNRTTAGSVAVDIWKWLFGTGGARDPVAESEMFLEWQSGVNDMADAVAGPNESWYDAVKKANEIIEENARILKEETKPAFDGGRHSAERFRKELRENSIGTVNDMTGALNDQGDYISESLVPDYASDTTGLTHVVSTLRKELRENSIGAVNDLTGKLNDQGDYISESLVPSYIGEGGIEPTTRIYRGELYKNTIPTVRDLTKKYGDQTLAIDRKLTPATTTLEKLLSGDFYGAITDVAGYLDETFSPAVEWLEETWTSLKEALAGPLTRAFNTFKNTVLNPIATVVDNIKTKVGKLLDKLGELIDKLPQIDIPWPWKEDSPSPFEQAIRNVMGAMDEMANDSAPMLAASMRGELGSFMVQRPQSNGRMATMPIQGGGNVSNRSTNVNMGGQVINNGMDAAALQATIERAMRNSI